MLLERFHAGPIIAEKDILNLSTFLNAPVLHTFSLDGFHLCVDRYAIFRIKPLHSRRESSAILSNI